MSLLFKELDGAETVKRVARFFNKDYERLFLLSGSRLTDISSPALSQAPGHTSGNHNENAIIQGITAGAMIDAVNDAIGKCSYSSQVILKNLLIRKESWQDVKNQLFCEGHKLGYLRKRACLEFADAFDSAQIRHKCQPIVDLHVYKENGEGELIENKRVI